ncbi:MAG: hypothetical protein E7432_03890 [Ruminococcaceae bacterium]|nr:hypothetical protein [Oscillospiraceae bacterium]
MTLPQRKSPRLKDFDYSTNGKYFVTVCTHEKKKLLSSIEYVGEGLCALPQIKLTEIGKIVEESIRFTGENTEGVVIEKYIIMPNHIHLLIELTAGGHGNPPLQDVIGRIKSYTTYRYGGKLWQRSFHDHCVRSEDDYLKIGTYIDSNHQKWDKDLYYI